MAVLGILAINLAGYAGPPAEVYRPVSHGTPPALDAAVYALGLVLFEGKMRALFAILFGAGIEAFVARADAAGRDALALQLRRLFWLAVFGYLHFLLFWWGDILFDYAVAGVAALAVRQLPAKALVAAALIVFTAWQANGSLGEIAPAVAEARAASGIASAREVAGLASYRARTAAAAASDLAQARTGFGAQIAAKLADRPFAPLTGAWAEFGEALPYMLIGIALLRSGFFARWPRARLGWTAAACLLLGGIPTLAFAAWAWMHGYPIAAMRLAINHALSFPHLLMALGYAALLVLGAPRILATALGRRLCAAGRAALSNYLGMTIVMTAIFYGWGLGLVGRVGTSAQAGFVLLGWALMLAWSAPWLRRYRRGPLEWLWRSLTEWRVLRFRT